jgi:peroxiredoxin Q/BCP
MLTVGSQAPDFNLPDQDGKDVKLESFKGQWVVLYFYPKDLTPGCTTEACNFQEVLPEIEGLNAKIIGVSKDPVKQHRKFADKYNLQFTLVTSENSNMVEEYGAWQEKSMYGKKYWGIARITYIINPKGKIAKAFEKVKPKEHHLEIQSALKELQ